MMFAAALAACDETSTGPGEAGSYFGRAEPLGNGDVRTYVELSDDGDPNAVGVAIAADA